MAYIPPHKRHSKDPQRPSPTPELLVPKFCRNLNLGSPKDHADKRQIAHADPTLNRWFAVSSDDDNGFPSSVHLERVSEELVKLKKVEKPLVLVNNNQAKDGNEVRGNRSTSPWELVAEKVWPDLLSACKIVKNEMDEKPTLVAVPGKVIFHGNNSLSLEGERKGQVAETTLRQLKKSFNTNVPASFGEKIINEVVPKIGFELEEDKVIFQVRLSDSTRQNSIISCKCIVKDDKKLELYKVKLKRVHHMVAYISCVYKNLDLRLMLSKRSILPALTDDEMNSIRKLINSAILDQEVKAGLRWPMGKSYSGDRYRVIGVWRTKLKSYKSPSVKLKVRHADWFDFNKATELAMIEIILKFRRIVSEIQEEKIDTDSIYNEFKDNLKLIWDYFLPCRQHLT